MGLRKYILGSVLLAIIIFGYTFSIEAGDYKLQLLDFTLLLPVAIWVVLPMVLLLILTIIHILYYGLKNYFTLKAISKDSQSLTALIKKRLLNETSELKFQNENFKEIGDIVSQLTIDVSNSNFSSANKDIAKAIDQKFTINSGKYISSKELKLEETNPIMINNIKNRISMDDNFALEVVKSPTKYSEELLKFAFLKAVKTKSMTSIKKVIADLKFDNEMVEALLKKDSEQKAEFAMTNDVILDLISKVELSNTQLINIAKDYKKSMAPDQVLKLFEDIASKKEELTTVYLYVLAEYEMIDQMRNILENSGTNEYIPFKALVDLKDAGKHTYSIDTLSYK